MCPHATIYSVSRASTAATELAVYCIAVCSSSASVSRGARAATAATELQQLQQSLQYTVLYYSMQQQLERLSQSQQNADARLLDPTRSLSIERTHFSDLYICVFYTAVCTVGMRRATCWRAQQRARLVGTARC
jgi:hypothetical protein